MTADGSTRDRRVHHFADHLVELLERLERRCDERAALVLDLVERDNVTAMNCGLRSRNSAS